MHIIIRECIRHSPSRINKHSDKVILSFLFGGWKNVRVYRDGIRIYVDFLSLYGVIISWIGFVNFLFGLGSFG